MKITIDPNLTQVAVIFGGRSTEHEVSIITGLEIVGALDVHKYQAIPVYIAQDGTWYAGPPLANKEFYHRLPNSLLEGTKVTLIPNFAARGLTILDYRPTWQQRLTGQWQLPIIPIDVFFPALHGSFGEDGCMQGLFELANVAYVGCGVLAAALGMNKAQCKTLLSAHKIPLLPWATVERETWRRDPIAARQHILTTPGLEQFPLFVKPCNLGSSIGIGAAADEAALDAALQNAFKFDTSALIEPQVEMITEINVSVMQGRELRASVVERPLSKTGVLTYHDKYGASGKGKKTQGRTGSLADAERRIDPADVAAEHKTQAQHWALKAFQALGCSGVARVDFILNHQTGELFLNEINTLPGSMSYYLWEHSQPPLSYTALLTELIEVAIQTKAIQNASERDSGLRVLFQK